MPGAIVRSNRWLAVVLAVPCLFLAGCLRTVTMRDTLPSSQYLPQAPMASLPPPKNQLAQPSTVVPTVPAPLTDSPATPASRFGAAFGPVSNFGGSLSGDRPFVKDPYIAELLAIMQETKSVDAFVMTLTVLVDAQPDHRLVVPTVIRNAERLGLFADRALKDEGGHYAAVSDFITASIDKLVHRETGTGCEKCPMAGKPVPVKPSVPDRVDDGKGIRGDYRTPIFPPITPGSAPACQAAPDEAEILRALPRIVSGVPCIYRESRDNIEFTAEKLVDKIDPPRFFPVIGLAQLHHIHWKCTVSFDETIESGYPIPFRATRRRTEVVYIDKDHLHLWSAASTKKDVADRSMRPRRD